MSLLQKQAPAERFLLLGEIKGMQVASCLCLLMNKQISFCNVKFISL
jgi:hypothetical protein